MRFAITGGNGFIGSFLAKELVKNGHFVRIVDLTDSAIAIRDVEYQKVDICSLQDLERAFDGIEYVAHLAAYSKIKDCIKNPNLAFGINVGGTLNVLLAARSRGISRVVYASSSSVYGDQTSLPFREDMSVCLLNPYAATKFGGEQICREFHKWCGLDVVALRLFNVYGSESAITGMADCPSVVEIFLKQRKSGQELTIIGDGSQRRDLVHVSDVAAAFMMAAESNLVGHGEFINIGSGVSHSVAEIAGLVSGKAIEVGSRYKEASETLADIRKAEKLLSWKPSQDLKEWIRSQLINQTL
jgi:UDP-glucose 4-epimerase